jgi:hypothetical protein
VKVVAVAKKEITIRSKYNKFSAYRLIPNKNRKHEYKSKDKRCYQGGCSIPNNNNNNNNNNNK